MKRIIASILVVLPTITLAQTAEEASSSAQSATMLPPYDFVSRPHSCQGYYPPAERKAHITGKTELHFTIGTEGFVSNISVAQSSGRAALDDAAIACAKHWKYRPAVKSGVPIASEWTADIIWKEDETKLPSSCASFYAGPPVDFSKIDGTTELEVTATSGAISKIVVEKSSGNDDLDLAAKVCMSTAHFTAFDESGDLVETRTTIKVAWKDMLSAPQPAAAQPTSQAAASQPTSLGPPAGTTPPTAAGSPHICDPSRWYPRDAIYANEQGMTELRFRVGTDGIPKGFIVSMTSGYAGLDQAAINCASTWKYNPAMRNRQPVEVEWSARVLWRQRR